MFRFVVVRYMLKNHSLGGCESRTDIPHVTSSTAQGGGGSFRIGNL